MRKGMTHPFLQNLTDTTFEACTAATDVGDRPRL
jgi:hypothetical protein